ncbi:hypothetical protein [Psittacicella gerlachiana]|uniref:Uncharacterized protein n=1 Tax=Psittacicella gerlachiana TaxID=2028574 RepID=A0A3A1Y3I2_9GAMM|nr:hypothetical protein [Psittacicella gerlachiana]RIY31869.1 hypothetical protein CKF59_07340 [Psittacicella gerlachiana]
MKSIVSKLKYLAYLLIFCLIIWQTIVHLDLSGNKKEFNRLEALTSKRTYTHAQALSEDKAIIYMPKYPLNIRNTPYLNNLTLGKVPYLENIWLNITASVDQKIIVIPNINLLELTNISALYPEAIEQGIVNFQALTWEQLQQVTFVGNSYSWQLLDTFLEQAKTLNISLWLNLFEAHKLYLDQNLDLSSKLFTQLEQSQVATKRINLVSPSLIILSHLRNDFLRKENRDYNLVFFITAGNSIPEVKPDVNLGYTSFVPVVNKVILDESYALAEINQDYQLIRNWYTNLILNTNKPVYIYADSLKLDTQFSQSYRLIQSSRYRGIISEFKVKDFYFAP